MRWARRILIAVALVVVLIGTAIILLLTIDLGRFKGNLENYVSDATGRQFAIAGRFEPSIGGTVDLVAEGVRLENAEWGTAENILELERLVVSVDTWSLLSGPIEVLNLEVEGLTLHVEKEPGTQQSSWSFGDAPAVADDDEYREPFELPLWLRQADLQRIRIVYGQGWLDAPREITITDADIFEDSGGLLNIDVSGAIGDNPIRADGLLGPLSALLDGHGPRWELEVSIGNFVTRTRGTFRDLFSLEGPQIDLVMKGPLAERILAESGLPPFASGPVRISGDLTEGPDGIELRIEGAFGDLTSEIVGRAQSLQTIENLELSVDLRGPDLQAIGELFNAEFLPSTEFAVGGDVTVTGDTLNLQSVVASAGDARLEVDGKLAAAEVDPDAQLRLSASGTEIRDFLPAALDERIPSGAFDVRAIATGGLQQPEVRELTAKLGAHEMTIDGILPVAADMTGLDIAVAARGPDFDQIVGPWADRDISTESYSANARISNNGAGFVVDDLTFELGATSVKFAGTLGTLPTFKGMNGSLTLSGENLEAVMEPWLDVDLPPVTFGLEGTFSEAKGALQLSNVTYHLGEARGELDGTTGVLPSLHGLKMNTSIAGPDASQFVELLGGLEDDALVPAEAFETQGTISKTSAGWFVNPWALRIGDSRLEMNGALGDFDGAAGIDIDIKASGPDLRRFLLNQDIESPVPYEVEGGFRVGVTEIELKEVDVRIGKTTAWLDGRVPTGSELINAEFDLRIAGPNLERAGRAFNIQDLPADPFSFEGSMIRAGQAYSVDKLIAVIGESDISGKLGVEVGPRIRVTGSLESNNLNLTGLLGEDDDTAEQDEDSADGDRIIPNTRLPLEVLDIADIDAILRLRHLVTDYFDVGDVELVIVMENDGLHVETGRVSLRSGGTMAAALDLVRTSDELADVQVSVSAEQFSLRPMIDSDGNPIDRPLADLNVALAVSGGTLRELAASANGSISLRQGEGDIDNDFSGYVMRDIFAQVFAAINPMTKKAKYTRLHCAFFEIDIVDGVAKSRALGLQTNELVVASVGTVNLATEALDLSFRIKQREGVGISISAVVNPYIKVGGTLASPVLTIDTKRGFWAGTFAAVTGGLSILARGVWDRYLSADNYCQTVIDALESGEIPVWEGE
jgi:uncharacterized protein involved in outer membrane biogenesis